MFLLSILINSIFVFLIYLSPLTYHYILNHLLFIIYHLPIPKSHLPIPKLQNSHVPLVLNSIADSILSMLRFMQLFAEGHYTELQQYLNTQYLNYHNYNLIQEVIDLLSTYFKFREQKYVENMTQCFDTLTEFIQGPCYENQRELVQDSFLELTKSLLDIDEIFQHLDKMENEKSNQGNDSNTNSMSSSLNLQQNSSQQLKQQKNQVMDMPSQPADGEKDQNNKLTKAISLDAMDLNKEQKVLEAKRKMQLPKYLIAKLQYKCSITLISLLEARKDNEIVNRMMKSLDIETITRNLSDCYYLFQEVGNQQYNPSLFLHFNIEPEKGNMKQIEQASFIIETGFNLYTVFSIFQEIGQDQEGGVKVEEEQEQESLLTNNIVGKIFKLSVSIVKAINLTIIEQAAKMKQMMMGTQKLNTEQTKNAILNVRANEQKQTMKFFQQNTLHIQILREDKLVEKTFFYCPPFCRALDKETKTNFNKDANRVSVQAKVTSIQLESEEIIQQMKHGFWLQTWLNQVKVMAVLAENIDLLRDVSFLMSISINIMIASRNGICQHAQRIFWLQLQLTIIFSLHKYTVTEQGITTTGTILIVLTTTIVSYFLAKTAPLLIMKAWVGVKQDKLNIFAYIQRLLMTVYYLLSDFYVLYYLIYGGTAILGVTYSAFFFFFQLFDVLVRYPVLLNVIQSVWIPQQSIAYTYFLFIVLMYCFTLFGYYQLRDSYPDGFCESTWICLVTAIDRSFKADGALGGYFHPTYTIPGRAHDTNYILVRYAFDNLYQIILMIVMVNIVSGIIIDTFGSLREELAEYLEDLETNCFICGYDSETIEKNSQNSLGFKYHIKNDHYQWNYVFYIAYLQDKDPTEYTGIQSYVADQVENDEIGWFPTGRALCLHQELEEDQNQIIIQSLQNILSRQTDLEESIKYLSDQIEDVEAQNEDAIIDDQSQEGVAEK